jgi:hypothetical protein
MIAHITICIMANLHRILQNTSRFLLHSEVLPTNGISLYAYASFCCTSEIPSEPPLQNSKQGLWNNLNLVGSCIRYIAFNKNDWQDHLSFCCIICLGDTYNIKVRLVAPATTSLGQSYFLGMALFTHAWTNKPTICRLVQDRRKILAESLQFQILLSRSNHQLPVSLNAASENSVVRCSSPVH